MSLLPNNHTRHHIPRRLRCQPFEENHDTRFFYPSREHGLALHKCEALVDDRVSGFAMLTGEIGCGKTMTRAVLREALERRGARVVEIENGLLDFDGLLLELVSLINGVRARSQTLPDRYSRLAAFKRALNECLTDAGQHLVIVIDEAQQLGAEALEGLRSLTNLVAERSGLLSIVLVGLPPLIERIAAMPAVDSRVEYRAHLGPLGPAELLRYLVHRMAFAGLQVSPPFTVDSLSVLHHISGGVPREVNRICRGALNFAVTHRLLEMDARLVHRIAADAGLGSAVPALEAT
ncbi:MAG: AAA family ATPase [Pseudomonadota bacterium]